MNYRDACWMSYILTFLGVVEVFKSNGLLNLKSVDLYYYIVQVLLLTCKVMAPFTPFFTEVLYQNMRKACNGLEESIHLCSFPQEEGKVYFSQLIYAETSKLVHKESSVLSFLFPMLPQKQLQQHIEPCPIRWG